MVKFLAGSDETPLTSTSSPAANLTLQCHSLQHYSTHVATAGSYANSETNYHGPQSTAKMRA